MASHRQDVFFITHSVEEALFLATRARRDDAAPGPHLARVPSSTSAARFLATRDARAVKSSTEFIRMREEVLAVIQSRHREAAHAARGPAACLIDRADTAATPVSHADVATAPPPATPSTARGAKRTSRFTMPGEGSSDADQRRHGRRAARAVVAREPPAAGCRRCSCRRREAVFQRLYESRGRRRPTDAPLAEHFGWSMFRVFTAFIAGRASPPSRSASRWACRAIARGIFDPPIEFYRPLPPLAYLPLIVIWFGIDELSKVAADLPRLLRAARDERARRRALGVAGADPRRVLDGRDRSGR